MTLVPFDDRDGSIWWNGTMVPWREATPHVLSHGLHYASAVFEGERAYNGSIFRLRDHTERLRGSARILGFEIPWTADQIDAACRQVLAANGLTDGYVRPIAWLGSEALGISPTGNAVHLAIAAWAWPNYYGDARMRGIRIGQAVWKRPSPETMPTMAKCTGAYTIGSMSKRRAEQEGYSDALMLDWRDRVAELDFPHFTLQGTESRRIDLSTGQEFPRSRRVRGSWINWLVSKGPFGRRRLRR